MKGVKRELLHGGYSSTPAVHPPPPTRFAGAQFAGTEGGVQVFAVLVALTLAIVAVYFLHLTWRQKVAIPFLLVVVALQLKALPVRGLVMPL